MPRIGYAVGWIHSPEEDAMADYNQAAAPMSVGMNVFPDRSHAETVLAAEKLKTPSLDWQIFEVHSDGN